MYMYMYLMLLVVHPPCCRFGDRLLAVNGQNFHNISRKKAAEVLRSCDQLAVTMEISRIMSKLKARSIVSHSTLPHLTQSPPPVTPQIGRAHV